jgi:chemotaxis protein MotA
MDIATIFGVLAGLFCMVVAVMADGGNFGLFFHIPAIVVVLGGTIAATCVHFTVGHVFQIASVVKKTIFYKMPQDVHVIERLCELAGVSRRQGVLALQSHLGKIGDTFLDKAVRMVIDGQPEDVVKQQLSHEIQYLQERHAEGKKMLEFMGAGCPAFGMVGTLIGLVQMFSHMESPEKIGAGMAVALVCTFYGAFLANLFFLPLAGKLGIRSKREIALRQMIVEGIIGIMRGESPMSIRDRMHPFVSPKRRKEYQPKAA